MVVDPAVRFGKPVIEDTRVPVEMVADENGITVDDVRATLRYAAHILTSEEIRGIA